MHAESTQTKRFISADSLLNDSFLLGEKIIADNFQPDILLALWRGGTPVAVAVQELFAYLGTAQEHFAIKTRHYTGINQRDREVEVEGMASVFKAVTPQSKILIIDDVFDSGLTIDRVATLLQHQFANAAIEVRTATVYYKPANNLTSRQPDYYVHITDKWIVFPHELVGLSKEEMLAGKTTVPALKEILAIKN